MDLSTCSGKIVRGRRSKGDTSAVWVSAKELAKIEISIFASEILFTQHPVQEYEIVSLK